MYTVDPVLFARYLFSRNFASLYTRQNKSQAKIHFDWKLKINIENRTSWTLRLFPILAIMIP